MVFARVLRCRRPILSPIYRRITDKRAAVTTQKQRVSGDCGLIYAPSKQICHLFLTINPIGNIHLQFNFI